MTEFVVPIIATWMKFIVTPVLGFVAIVFIGGGGRSVLWCVQLLRGARPIPAKATRASTVGAMLLLSIAVIFGAGAGFLLLSLLTTQPYVISDSGVTVGARPLGHCPGRGPRTIVRDLCRGIESFAWIAAIRGVVLGGLLTSTSIRTKAKRRCPTEPRRWNR